LFMIPGVFIIKHRTAGEVILILLRRS
jgi:hypothetical protein